MASIFTYDPDPPRVSSPWSTSGSSTPQQAGGGGTRMVIRNRSNANLDRTDADVLSDYGITKLEPEPQEGPTEYKLHLMLRSRRYYASVSTGHLVSGSYHSRASLSTSGPTPSSYESNPKPSGSRSTLSRQQRLQSLTTQLLWRLQQSSPFHSSTAANLVLPVLPDATDLLGAPQKPSRLLPGLEESQGALYEIGVADDGTFVGLAQDELEESLSNLQAMAASLGCKVDILRRVIVGKCEWTDDVPAGDAHDDEKVHTGDLWVAEALVSPDWDFYKVPSPRKGSRGDSSGSVEAGQTISQEGCFSSTEQIRVSISGPSTAGKSSLLGTLTSSVLDNGRGTSRLSLLKHRHEISSGITSSVAHELIGYSADAPAEEVNVINYASGNVAAWDDVHAAAQSGRLAFVSDLPGSVRYLKSTLRGLISWAPHYVLLCIPANCEDDASSESGNGASEQTTDISLALSHLELCVKLDVPTIVVITKMDLASLTSLRTNLTRVLSALKTAGKKPAMLPAQPNTSGMTVDLQHIEPKDSKEVRKIVQSTDNWSSVVPIVLASAVDGTGIGKLHALLRYLPIPTRPPPRSISIPRSLPPTHLPTNVFDIDEVFAIPPSKVYSVSAEQPRKENHGVVLCGLVRYGAISVGDELVIGPLLTNTFLDQGLRSRLERHSGTHSQHDSTQGRPPSQELSASFVQNSVSGKTTFPTQAQWQRVRVVSVRNLRLPVQKLIQDQVGTVGVEPLPSQPMGQLPRLGKVRKGTVLASLNEAPTSIPKSLLFHTGFVASFASSEFASSLSPPLLLGGNAIVYIANIRSTVKVTCMALAEDEVVSRAPSPTEPEFFNFDGDVADREEYGESEVNDTVRASRASSQEDVKITFSFVTSVEWVEIGSRVLLMPGASVALASAQNSVTPSGLEGFVGRVCEVLYPEFSTA
ncbi:uncharacterized protein KD926_009021 [Aspergillus affinis]|uniref:uncharacterized protein n=1 Tax=Aspergillus affinis TaxID=1070780 RepID=UPI0022FDD3CF|nr:P-loop containing nucleoside triphosphate hydrolase protein [Aspergillus affinis]KAI9039803.1 P-loop containing nucleoside triphosphate hydrolase protein [Aspergillus affinis]